MPCPICAEPGGFHSDVVHSRLVIPSWLLLEKDWLKRYLEAMKKAEELLMHPT